MQIDRKPFPKYFGIDMALMKVGDHFTIVKSEYDNYFFAVRYVEQQAKVFNMDIWIEENDLQYDIWIVKVGLRSTQNIQSRIYDAIVASGKSGILKTDIIKKFSNHSSAQIFSYLEKLCDLGQVNKDFVSYGTRGRPKLKFISSDAFLDLDTSPETVE